MPFTISHAAAALPVHAALGRRLPLAALMAGSMAPDFVFYLPHYLEYDRSHSFSGLFTICLPLGMLVWLFFVLVLERPTLSWLPAAWRTRIAPTQLNAATMLAAAGAVWLGALTHLAWDSFTHYHTPVAQAWPLLREPVALSETRTMPLYFLLQLLSSLFGLVVLALWAWRIPRRPALPVSEVEPEASPAPTAQDRVRVVVWVLVLAYAVAMLNRLRYGHIGLDATVFVMLVGAMAGTALGWTLATLWIRWRTRTAALLN